MKIAIAGKGGTGKTTLTAWLGKYLAEKGNHVWLIDADTTLSLGSALGIEKERLPLPLSQNKDLIAKKIGSNLLVLNPDVEGLAEEISIQIPSNGGSQRLIVMGTISNAGEGCACHANALLKVMLSHMIEAQNDWVLLDLEGGIEHLGRGSAEKVDALLILTEADLRSLDIAVKISSLAKELGLSKQILLLNGWSQDLEIPQDYRHRLPQKVLRLPVMQSLVKNRLEDPCVTSIPDFDLLSPYFDSLLHLL